MVTAGTGFRSNDNSSVQEHYTQPNSNLNMLSVARQGDFGALSNTTNTASQHLSSDLTIVDEAAVQPPQQPGPADTPHPADKPPAAEQLSPGEEKHGATTVKRDDQGNIKEYDNGDYTLAKHDDGKWFFHQNGDGHDFIEVESDSIKMDDQGKVTYNESGLFGKNDQTLGNGSTGFMSSITSAAENVADQVVEHPLDTVNSIAFAPLAVMDAVTGTHSIQAIGEIEKGAVNEIKNNPGEILRDVAIGAAIGALTVATGGGALVALGIGAAALATTELVKNDGDLGGVLNDAKEFGNTVVDWGGDLATVAGTGQHSAEELAEAQQGLQQLGAFGAHMAAGTAGGVAGGVGAEMAGLRSAIPNAVRSGVSRPSGSSGGMPEGGPTPNPSNNTPNAGHARPDDLDFSPTGRAFEPGVLEAKLSNLKSDLGIRSWQPKSVQRAKLMEDLEGSARIQVARNGDNVHIVNGNTRYALAKQLGIPDSEIPVWGGPNMNIRQLMRSDASDAPTEPIPVSSIRPLHDAGDAPTEPISVASLRQAEAQEPVVPLENRGAFTLPNGKPIDAHTMQVMRSAGLTQDDYVYRVMNPKYLDTENNLVAGNPDSCASILHPDTPARVFKLPDGTEVKLPRSSNASDAGPGLNVATRNPAGAYGRDGSALIAIRLGDMLAANGRVFKDTSAGLQGAYYVTFDGAVPYFYV